MIFLTVGSELPFDRLVRAVDLWCETNKRDDVFGQIADPGPNGYYPCNFKWEQFVSPNEYRTKYNEAELIIGHAGMGSIISALVKATPILIMPRRSKYHETRNDHQVSTAIKFSKHKGVFVADNEDSVGKRLNQWGDRRKTLTLDRAGPYAEVKLINTLREFILNKTIKS